MRSYFIMPLASLVFCLASAQAGQALLWQGLDHQWQREAFGVFQTPHRISLLSSLIENQEQGAGQVLIGQSPGVDGDFMQAKMYLSQLDVPGIDFSYQVVELNFSDKIESDLPLPIQSKSNGMAIFPLSLTNSEAMTNSAVLGGFSIESECVDLPGHTCNSNGFWPYQMGLEIHNCARVASTIQCPVEVSLGRAWTPNGGGVPGLDRKPYNYAMNFNVKIGVLLAQGSANELAVHRDEYLAQVEKNTKQIKKPYLMENSDLEIGPSTARSVGIHKIQFEFLGRHGNQPGRYLSGLSLWAQTSTGLESHQYNLSGLISIPRTVNKTPINLKMGLTTWSFADTNAKVTQLAPRVADICMESRNAPFYSQWNGCQRLGFPVDQDHQILEVPAL